MAITLTTANVHPEFPALAMGNARARLVTVTYSGTYAQGGDSITPGSVGFSEILAIFPSPVGESLGANRSEVAQYNSATGKLVLYFGDATVANTMTEVAAGVTLTGFKVTLLIFGI